MNMLIKQRRSWELPESAATSESVYMNRREWLKAAGFAGLGLAISGLMTSTAKAAIAVLAMPPPIRPDVARPSPAKPAAFSHSRRFI